jgi:lysophospholipase L1-like esterase
LDAIRKQAGNAKLIWATTTPVRERSDLKKFGERTERVKVRNQLAAEIMKERAIPSNDLFGLVENQPDWYSSDGTHFNAKGKEAQAKQVAESVAGCLPAKESSGGNE